MRKIWDMLGGALGRDEVVRAARAQIVLADWDEIVGATLGTRSHPDRYDHGTVFVAVTGSEWAQELRMNNETILQRLRERANEPSLFIDVRFGVRPFNKAEPTVNEPFDEEARKEELRKLSIAEIKERRLKAMMERENGE